MQADTSAGTISTQAGSGARFDPLTVVAITALVYTLGSLIHEGLGHGGACLVSGGHPLQLTSVYFNCSADNRLIDAGGTLLNAAAGLLFWLGLRHWRSASIHWRVLLWLAMAHNLMDAAGYFLFSGVSGFGDWAMFIQGLAPHAVWRVGLVVVGVILYPLVVWLAARELRALLPATNWIPTARRLTWLPYFAGGTLSCIAGAFNPQGMILVAVSAAAASFGGASGFIWMSWLLAKHPGMFPGERGNPGPVTRSIPWMVAGVASALFFIFVFGPGFTFK